MKITRLIFIMFLIISILYLNNFLFTINSDILLLSSIIPVKSDYSKDKFYHVISQDQLEIFDKNIPGVLIGSLLGKIFKIASLHGKTFKETVNNFSIYHFCLMLFACIATNMLAIALPSLRISPLLIRISSIVLLYAVAVICIVAYIQSIGSGIGVFNGLFCDFFSVQNFNKDYWLVEETFILFSSLLPIKPKRLSNLEKQQFTLPEELKQILVGLLLGDLYSQKRTKTGNAVFRFEQGISNKEYIYHLYDLFESYCPSLPASSLTRRRRIVL